MSKYTKAIVAFLGFIAAGLPLVGISADFLTPELQTTITSAITAILVYALPNTAA